MSEEKNCEQQSTSFSCSIHSHSCILLPLSDKPGNIKLSSSEPGFYCIHAITESPKLCPKCGTKLTAPNPVSFSVSVEHCECDYETLPSSTVSEEGETHEHKSNDTPGYIYNSQGVQPSDEDSESCPASCTEACSSLSSVKPQKPVYIDPRLKDHVPKSVEELKASITGLTGLEKSVRNLHGCEFIEFRCEMRKSESVCEPQDSKPNCSYVPIRQGFSLTMEPNDHRFCTNPDDCKHTRPPPTCASEEPPCQSEEPPCSSEEPPCPPGMPPCPPEEPPCAPQKPPCGQ